MSPRQSCDEVREIAPDIALGLLTGEERADALAHLEQCEACRAEVATLAVAADEVLLAGPRATPPAGFAERTLARLANERAAGDGLPPASGPPAGRAAGRGRRARTPRRRLVAVALAAAAAVVVAVGLTAVLGGGGSPGGEVAVADLRTGTGVVVGEATAEGDASSLVTVDVPAWDELVERWGDAPGSGYWLVVEQDDGTRTMHALADDVQDWSMRVDAEVDDIATVAMLDGEGRVWCSGAFEPA